MNEAANNGSILKALMRRLHGPIYEKRIAVLSQAIVGQLQAGDQVLDVGCGSGILGRAIMDAPNCPAGVKVSGLENHKRGGEAIEVIAYDGKTIPLPDRSVDVVILADVLHHEPIPERLLGEAIRVARRMVFVKDHKVDGLLAQQRISFLDWAANIGYGVKCLYRYPTAQGWREFAGKFPVKIAREISTMDIYPPFFNFVFGKRLHYCAVLDTRGK
jgi:SAM-dependent methyltransferase